MRLTLFLIFTPMAGVAQWTSGLCLAHLTVEPTVVAGNKKVNRVQTGVRIEKRILKVLKALAAHHEMSLGDLIEGIVLHSFEGKSAFEADSLAFIKKMRTAYGLDLTAADSHKLTEE